MKRYLIAVLLAAGFVMGWVLPVLAEEGGEKKVNIEQPPQNPRPNVKVPPLTEIKIDKPDTASLKKADKIKVITPPRPQAINVEVPKKKTAANKGFIPIDNPLVLVPALTPWYFQLNKAGATITMQQPIPNYPTVIEVKVRAKGDKEYCKAKESFAQAALDRDIANRIVATWVYSETPAGMMGDVPYHIIRYRIDWYHQEIIVDINGLSLTDDATKRRTGKHISKMAAVASGFSVRIGTVEW